MSNMVSVVLNLGPCVYAAVAYICPFLKEMKCNKFFSLISLIKMEKGRNKKRESES